MTDKSTCPCCESNTGVHLSGCELRKMEPELYAELEREWAAQTRIIKLEADLKTLKEANRIWRETVRRQEKEIVELRTRVQMGAINAS